MFDFSSLVETRCECESYFSILCVMCLLYWKGNSWQTTSARRMQSGVWRGEKRIEMLHVQWQYYTSSWMVKNRYSHCALSSSPSLSSSSSPLSLWSNTQQNEMNFNSWAPHPINNGDFLFEMHAFSISASTLFQILSLSIQLFVSFISPLLHSTPFQSMWYAFLLRFLCEWMNIVLM